MSTWQIQIPARGRDQGIVDALCDTNAVADPEARAVARLILGEAAESGVRTVGEVLDRIERADPAQRRGMLNEARVAAGLETVEDVVAHRQFLAANDAARHRAAGRPLPSCPACGTRPCDLTGMPDVNFTPVKRWWCEAHRDQAARGDLDPPPSGIGPDMSPVPDPDEAARARREDERRRAEDERRRAERAAESEAIQRARRRYYERHKNDPYVNPLSGAGWRAAP